MKLATAAGMALLALCLSKEPGRAHYNMLLPDTASAKRGDTVAFLYQWGHPFEHQLFDAPAPRTVSVLHPDGKKSDLTDMLEKGSVPAADGKGVAAWRFRFKAEQRGDYVFVLTTQPIWMEEEQEFWQDTVKVVLHVQVQKGWDAPTASTFEIVPLTRPYGLQPGTVFQGVLQIHSPPTAKGSDAHLIEVERYNATPPKSLPSDEQITRTLKTDPNHVLTCTLMDAGWWSITAQREGGQMARDGKQYRLRQRTTFWVYVDEKISAPGMK